MHSGLYTLDDVRRYTRSKQLYDEGFTGKGVTVAVADTGIDPSHPMLEGQVRKAISFVPEPAGVDGAGHGTFVGSEIAGNPVEYVGKVKELNGKTLQGMAPDAKLIDLRVLNSEGAGLSSGIIRSIQQAVEEGADILNMSLGSLFGGAGRLADAEAVNAATERGVRCVVAAGNSFGVGPVGSPGRAGGASRWCPGRW